MDATIACNVARVLVVAEVAGGVAPCTNGVARATETRLRAERGVFLETFGVVIRVDQEHKIGMSDIAARRINGLERVAAAVSETSDDRPAGLLFESGGAGRRDDLGIDNCSGVRDVAGRVARRGHLQ